MFVLETIQTEGIAQLSYFLADKSSGQALVIDPRTDVEIYLRLARKHEVSITDILETHVHADFVCGSRELCLRTNTSKIWVSGVEADYDFRANRFDEGHEFAFRSFKLLAKHTPGHTPEHMAFELYTSNQPESLVAVFSGDSLFAGSAGRPDLLGDEQTDILTRKQYETLYDYYLDLEDHVLIYPGHGAGSACGAGISDRLCSTIGYERRHNPFLRHRDFESFYEHVVVEAPHAPSHYPRLKKVNAGDRPTWEILPAIKALPPKEFNALIRQANTIVLDTRQMLAFAGGHIAGAINIGNRPELSVWVGEMFNGDENFLIVSEDDSDIATIQRRMIRTGNANIAGYLAGGMRAWEESGLAMSSMPITTAVELRDALESHKRIQLLDVRSEEEHRSGFIPGSTNYFVADMRHRIDGLDKAKTTVVYCESGYRASIAASLMQSRGFEKVHNVPGSWKAWEGIGGPVEMPAESSSEKLQTS